MTKRSYKKIQLTIGAKNEKNMILISKDDAPSLPPHTAAGFCVHTFLPHNL